RVEDAADVEQRDLLAVHGDAPARARHDLAGVGDLHEVGHWRASDMGSRSGQAERAAATGGTAASRSSQSRTVGAPSRSRAFAWKTPPTLNSAISLPFTVMHLPVPGTISPASATFTKLAIGGLLTWAPEAVKPKERPPPAVPRPAGRASRGRWARRREAAPPRSAASS